MSETPVINVGIVTSPRIEAVIDGTTWSVTADDLRSQPSLWLPEARCGWFELKDVTIGVNFHWERRENQRFEGRLKIVRDADKVVAINVVPVEKYLVSVISSEMSADARLEFLKAHAVISRSWVLAQLGQKMDRGFEWPMKDTDDEIVRWYNHEDHSLFDVCADDHCQRYQGITRASTPQVQEAVKSTAGRVLTYGDTLCDARFSKCCGGVMEEFETCWEPVPHPYLKAVRDTAEETGIPDLTDEAEARKWILGRPDSFCRTSDPEILGRVLNNYDRETSDFYRWTVRYSADELSGIIAQRTGRNLGRIRSVTAIERGKSGRIKRLRIEGTLHTLTIGKELEIRRSLSTSHLYSSAFVAEGLRRDSDGIPAEWEIRGAGWGHGVGLCQIGAAVMVENGFDHLQVLHHYYPGAEITKIY